MKNGKAKKAEGAIVIEKGIERPVGYVCAGVISNTIRTMKVGDSFKVPNGYSRNATYAGAKNVGVKISVRKMPDGTVRVWRIA